ncbi:hypothetical protein ACE4RR_10580 [Alteribacillus sp. HJP-4]
MAVETGGGSVEKAEIAWKRDRSGGNPTAAGESGMRAGEKEETKGKIS